MNERKINLWLIRFGGLWIATLIVVCLPKAFHTGVVDLLAFVGLLLCDLWVMAANEVMNNY